MQEDALRQVVVYNIFVQACETCRGVSGEIGLEKYLEANRYAPDATRYSVPGSAVLNWNVGQGLHRTHAHSDFKKPVLRLLFTMHLIDIPPVHSQATFYADGIVRGQQ